MGGEGLGTGVLFGVAEELLLEGEFLGGDGLLEDGEDGGVGGEMHDGFFTGVFFDRPLLNKLILRLPIRYIRQLLHHRHIQIRLNQSFRFPPHHDHLTMLDYLVQILILPQLLLIYRVLGFFVILPPFEFLRVRDRGQNALRIIPFVEYAGGELFW